MLMDNFGDVLELSKWIIELKSKAQANAKAILTLQCGLAPNQLDKVSPFKNAKEIWKKFIKLYESTRDSHIAKRDLFFLVNCRIVQ